jgi:DegV family protein with EDD domain
MMVEAAIKSIAAGATRQDVAEQIEQIKEKMHIFFVVDTLEYLAKGGRIGNAKAFLGTVLKVKPILTVQDGAIEPMEQVRSKRKALARMLDLVEECLGEDALRAHLAITNSLVPQEALAISRELTDRLGCTEATRSDLGPVIGTHTGPGTIGVAAYV